MNRKSIAVISIIMVSLCILSVVLLTLPSVTPVFSLSAKGKSDVATALTGLTAPVIGIVSSILLYLALTKQAESNNEQRSKNEIDLIFLLFSQLETAISAFSTEETTGPKDKREKQVKTGAHGMDYFAYHNLPLIAESHDIKLFHLFEWPKISLIVNSSRLLEEKINGLSTKENLGYKTLLLERINTIYDYQLRQPLEKIFETVDKFPHISEKHVESVRVYVLSKKHQ